MDMHIPELAATLVLAGGGGREITDGVRADPASQGRITVRIPVGDVPRSALIAEVTIRSSTGAVFFRSFAPRLTVPPAGTLSVSFGTEDIQAGYPEMDCES